MIFLSLSWSFIVNLTVNSGFLINHTHILAFKIKWRFVKKIAQRKVNIHIILLLVKRQA